MQSNQKQKNNTLKTPERNKTGRIDFGKDGRLVIIDDNSKNGSTFFKIKDTKTFKINVGDKVEYKISDTLEGYGEIVRVKGSGKRFISGRFENHISYGIVHPDSREIKKEIIVASEHFFGAMDGDKVHLEILNPEGINDEFSDLRGRIIEVLGKSGERGAEEKSIMRKFNLVKDFPKDVEREAKTIKITYDLKDRVDLRDKNIFTIDPEDAKDFDDAVSIEKLKDGTYMLGVHIADVSHYVTENTPLDKEALRRATSVYLVKNVIPMLPEKLSNDICSLKQDEDRSHFFYFYYISEEKHFKEL